MEFLSTSISLLLKVNEKERSKWSSCQKKRKVLKQGALQPVKTRYLFPDETQEDVELSVRW